MRAQEYRTFLQGLRALSVLGRQVQILVPPTPQIQIVHAMLLAQGSNFVGATPGELFLGLPDPVVRGGREVEGRRRDRVTRPREVTPDEEDDEVQIVGERAAPARAARVAGEARQARAREREQAAGPIAAERRPRARREGAQPAAA